MAVNGNILLLVVFGGGFLPWHPTEPKSGPLRQRRPKPGLLTKTIFSIHLTTTAITLDMRSDTHPKLKKAVKDASKVIALHSTM